jgi:SAM-dependent methyltransferase
MNVLAAEMTPEMEALKARLKATWMSGDYGHFATYLEPGALEFLSRINIEPGARVLDVACGAGQIAIPMSRAGAKVTGVDIATNLIEQARARAQAENLDAHFDEGDAEMLPYQDGSFDLVVSLIGAMFAPRPELVAAELKRVCRPGGKIIMGNWTPTGFVGQMFKIHGKHVPPPATPALPGTCARGRCASGASVMPSPVKWGDEETVRERLNDGISHLKLSRRLYPFRYPFPPAEVVEFFRTYYGPSYKAFDALNALSEKQSALREELEQLWTEHNSASDGATAIASEYLEVVAIRQ